jgi:hypothetical protein
MSKKIIITENVYKNILNGFKKTLNEAKYQVGQPIYSTDEDPYLEFFINFFMHRN